MPNIYACLWKNIRVEVESDTTYHAQQLAITKIQPYAGRRKVKRPDVDVVLISKDGKDVVHPPTM